MGLLPSIPEPVADFSPATLEWEGLLALLSQYATAAVTREWLMALAPSISSAWATEQHGLVAEMRICIVAGVRPALAALFDPATSTAKARIPGTALEVEELLPLLALGDDVVAWYIAMQEPREDLAPRIPALRAMTEPLRGNQLAPLLRSLRSRISPDGTLSDDASPDLKRIRREIERQQRAIESSLRQALRRFSGEGSTQEDLITIRGERFVIPVKAEWKRRIPGVVHGASSSGQSVYIEPLETIEQNNELIRLLDEEQAEVHRIFVQMTSEIAREASTLSTGASVLAQVDALQARARFAEEYECTAPIFATNESPELLVQNGRHPLLERRLRRSHGTIVPLTLGLESAARQLIISGPNTGGKTVALKTAGLLAMMAQAGIPVPAERLVLPVFRSFLADIGDAQSIEQNLSTFSAHIVNLNRIAAKADEHSLVLLDELGSATDPEEGAALAVAIAGHFLLARAWSIISTHHTSLKVYAAQVYEGKHKGVLNAAVGFDEQTLAPTYALRLGVPGASAGINIAQRIGLDPAIVTAARRQLSHQTEDIAHFLDRLHADLAAVDRERAALQQRESEVERERQRLETEGLKEWKAKVRELEQQLAALLKDFEFRMREAVKAIDDRMQQQKLSKEAERRIARLRREFAEQFNATAIAQHTGADKGDPQAQPHIVRHVSAGDTVRLKSLGRVAIVERQIDDSNFEVAMGPMKMRVPRGDIAEVISSRRAAAELNPIEAARRRGVSVTMASSSDDMRAELNVIGRTVADASAEVESFLDHAFLAGLERVRIIHGTGMGVLRRALRTMLASHPHVATVTEATQAEGGSGATIVDLRQ
ncbi:MAG: Smr/MutS family protein [Acidobacteriaceae bacterium]